MTSTDTLRTARLGNGSAIHLANRVAEGHDFSILCNRWGSVSGVIRSPKLVEGAEATCKRCQKIAEEA